jgi:hypothetical protein
MRNRLVVCLLALVAVSCSDGEGGGDTVSSPCDLADAALVQAYFSGTVSDGVEGEARNCEFDIEGGSVVSVSVFHFGSADGWEGTKSGYEDNRGGVTDVAGIGEDAYHPNDVGPAEMVVRAGGEIFAVSVFTTFIDPEETDVQAVADLAERIADSLGSDDSS